MFPHSPIYPYGPLPQLPVPATDLLTIEHREADGLIAVRWVGSCTFDRLRDVYERVAALLRRTGVHRVLFDTREREIIGQEAARWVATEAYAALLADRQNPLRLAYAAPEVVVSAISGQPESAGSMLRLGVFASPGAAVAWLKQG